MTPRLSDPEETEYRPAMRRFEALADCGKESVTLSIDSTSIKAHRSASGGKAGSMNRRSAAHAAGAPRRSTR